MVPKAQEVRVPVTVPYKKEVKGFQDEHIMYEAEVTEMRPKIVLEKIDELIPVYKLVEKVTPVAV